MCFILHFWGFMHHISATRTTFIVRVFSAPRLDSSVRRCHDNGKPPDGRTPGGALYLSPEAWGTNQKSLRVLVNVYRVSRWAFGCLGSGLLPVSFSPVFTSTKVRNRSEACFRKQTVLPDFIELHAFLLTLYLVIYCGKCTSFVLYSLTTYFLEVVQKSLVPNEEEQLQWRDHLPHSVFWQPAENTGNVF